MIRLKSFLPFAVLFLTGRIAFAQQEDAEGLKEQFVQEKRSGSRYMNWMDIITNLSR